MKTQVQTLDCKVIDTLDLSDDIFGLEPREDLLHRMVLWQLARRQVGSHFCRTRGEVNRTSKKLGRQKGSGGARHGSRRSGIFVGGGKAFGPRPRSHAHDLPKKVRRSALKSALSAKALDEKLIVLDHAVWETGKTKDLKKAFSALGIEKALIIDGPELHEGFALAARNLVGIDVLPIQGINVYDILRRPTLVLTKAAVEHLEARLK